MNVLVLTVVHTPLDARIYHRQVRALLDAGHDATLAAPFTDHGVTVDAVDARLATIDLPRATKRRRAAATVAAIRLLRRVRGRFDVLLLHDPELLLAAALAQPRTPVVWDVHEDLAASLGDKPWLPAAVRPVARQVACLVERWAEARCSLILAEHGYRARFRRDHAVVPNYPPLPPVDPGAPRSRRVVYLGRVSRLRGAAELVEVGRRLRRHGIAVQVVGPVDDDVRAPLEEAHEEGSLELLGFVPNAQALAMLDGALAGLSLLHDHPNYRHSLPTKVLEYQAAGVPVVSTPLPAAVEVLESSGGGVVVPFGDVDAVVEAIVMMHDDAELARRYGRAGRADAQAGRSWDAVRGRFLAAIEAAAPD